MVKGLRDSSVVASWTVTDGKFSQFKFQVLDLFFFVLEDQPTSDRFELGWLGLGILSGGSLHAPLDGALVFHGGLDALEVAFVALAGLLVTHGVAFNVMLDAGRAIRVENAV